MEVRLSIIEQDVRSDGRGHEKRDCSNDDCNPGEIALALNCHFSTPQSVFSQQPDNPELLFG
jgi:hypothetical protein